jgi:hypothetical protein
MTSGRRPVQPSRESEESDTLALGIYGTRYGEQRIVARGEFQPITILRFVVCTGAAQKIRQKAFAPGADGHLPFLKTAEKRLGM